jgi:ribosome maturation factor RimP
LSSVQEQLIQLLKQPIIDLGYEFIGLRWIANQRPATLRLYIDSSCGISVEDCATVSRQVSSLLDVEDPLRSPYQLEVSSPGLARPLFTPEHYQRFLGSSVAVLLQSAVHDRRKWCGVLQAVEGTTVLITVEESTQAFELSNIQEAHLIPPV